MEKYTLQTFRAVYRYQRPPQGVSTDRDCHIPAGGVLCPREPDMGGVRLVDSWPANRSHPPTGENAVGKLPDLKINIPLFWRGIDRDHR